MLWERKIIGSPPQLAFATDSLIPKQMHRGWGNRNTFCRPLHCSVATVCPDSSSGTQADIRLIVGRRMERVKQQICVHEQFEWWCVSMTSVK